MQITTKPTRVLSISYYHRIHKWGSALLFILCALFVSVPVRSQNIQLSNCDAESYGVFSGCEVLVTLSSAAELSDSSVCDGTLLYWDALVDLNSDGEYDYEFSSSLPPFDSNLGNDTNQNGIGDAYLSSSISGESVELLPLHFE